MFDCHISQTVFLTLPALTFRLTACTPGNLSAKDVRIGMQFITLDVCCGYPERHWPRRMILYTRLYDRRSCLCRFVLTVHALASEVDYRLVDFGSSVYSFFKTYIILLCVVDHPISASRQICSSAFTLCPNASQYLYHWHCLGWEYRPQFSNKFYYVTVSPQL